MDESDAFGGPVFAVFDEGGRMDEPKTDDVIEQAFSPRPRRRSVHSRRLLGSAYFLT